MVAVSGQLAISSPSCLGGSRNGNIFQLGFRLLKLNSDITLFAMAETLHTPHITSLFSYVSKLTLRNKEISLRSSHMIANSSMLKSTRLAGMKAGRWWPW